MDTLFYVKIRDLSKSVLHSMWRTIDVDAEDAEETGRGYKTICKDFELNPFTVRQTVCKARKLKNAVSLLNMVEHHRSAQQQTGMQEFTK